MKKTLLIIICCLSLNNPLEAQTLIYEDQYDIQALLGLGLNDSYDNISLSFLDSNLYFRAHDAIGEKCEVVLHSEVNISRVPADNVFKRPENGLLSSLSFPVMFDSSIPKYGLAVYNNCSAWVKEFYASSILAITEDNDFAYVITADSLYKIDKVAQTSTGIYGFTPILNASEDYRLAINNDQIFLWNSKGSSFELRNLDLQGNLNYTQDLQGLSSLYAVEGSFPLDSMMVFYSVGSTDSSSLMAINPDGTEAWNYADAYSINSLIKTNNAIIALGAENNSTALMKFDFAGNVTAIQSINHDSHTATEGRCLVNLDGNRFSALLLYNGFASRMVTYDDQFNELHSTSSSIDPYRWLYPNEQGGIYVNNSLVVSSNDLSSISFYQVYGLDIAEEMEGQVSFYPNPSNGPISFNETMDRVVILGLSGQEIETYYSANTLDLSALAMGVYLMELHLEGKKTIQKLVLR